jgi:hypothetical protein
MAPAVIRVFGFGFQLPNYQISQLPNLVGYPPAPIAVIPIWRRLQQLPNQIAFVFLRVSVPPWWVFGFAFQLPDYQISQLPKSRGVPSRSDRSHPNLA